MKKQVDYILLFTIIALVCAGFLFLMITSIPFSLDAFGSANYFTFHQLTRGLMPGLILAVLFFLLPIDRLKKIIPFLFLISIILTILVFFPGIGIRHGGASRWINVLGFRFQPSELLKLTTVLYLALWFENKLPLKKKVFRKANHWSKRAKTKIAYNLKNFLLPFFFIIGLISLILIFQPDISTLGVIIAVSCLIYFASYTPLWHTIFIMITGISGVLALTLIRIPAFSYRYSRLELLFNPEIDPLGRGFQIRQSLIAIGSGGITGRGLGMSSQKFGFLPHPMSDSIFSVIAEEIGFIGCFILVSLFLILLWRGIKMAKNSNNSFLSLASLGIVGWIVIQAFVNMASLSGILPLTGIPLPFVSLGGSHLMVELMAMGILLNISKNA